RLAFCAVNHRIPLWSKINVCGSFTSGSGILYSVTAPVFGSSLPIKAPVFPVYQMLPSLSSSRPCGPECGVLSGYSLIRPVLGSSRPSTLAIWPVYQSDPSLAAKGTCGREPGVGTCHAWLQAGRAAHSKAAALKNGSDFFDLIPPSRKDLTVPFVIPRPNLKAVRGEPPPMS